ncbi:MAG: hypothetical protein QOH89_1758, partial [Pseudonocardiales bacterium]|nr:hypothetical protein [Pseudonocardiales bacterium]
MAKPDDTYPAARSDSISSATASSSLVP